MLINLIDIQTWVEGNRVCSDVLLVAAGAGRGWDSYPLVAQQRISQDSWGRFGALTNHIIGDGYMADSKVIF